MCSSWNMHVLVMEYACARAWNMNMHVLVMEYEYACARAWNMNTHVLMHGYNWLSSCILIYLLPVNKLILFVSCMMSLEWALGHIIRPQR